jgi:hypothetical protein
VKHLESKALHQRQENLITKANILLITAAENSSIFNTFPAGWVLIFLGMLYEKKT